MEKDTRYDYIFVALRRPSSPFVALRRPSSPFVALRRPSSPKLAALLLMAAAPFAFAGSASAQQFKVTATGTLSSVSNSGGYYDSSVAVGTPFTETFFFDYSVVNVGTASVGEYAVSNAVSASGESIGADVSYGDYHFLLDPGFVPDDLVVVANNSAANSYEVDLSGSTHFVNGVSAPYSYGGGDLSFPGTPGQYNLTTNTLPPLDFYRHFPLGQISFVSFITGGGNKESDVSGTVTSVTAELVNPVAAVPEASTWVSLGVMLGLGGLGVAVRRRRVMGA